MTKYRFALCAFAFACPSSMLADGALAQQPSRGSTVTSAKGGTALNICREKIASSWGSGSTKMGPVEALRGAELRFQATTANLSVGPDSVRVSKVRLFRARVQGTNFLGMPLDFYAVCFLEDRGGSHRFIQICTTKGPTSNFSNCNFGWIVRDALYDAVLKQRGR